MDKGDSWAPLVSERPDSRMRASPTSRSRSRGFFSRQTRQQPEDLGLEVTRQARPVRLLRDDRREDVGDRLPAERAPAGQALVQNAAEGPQVGALVDRLAARLLGAHVGRRTEHEALLGHEEAVGLRRRRALLRRARTDRLREPEVEDLDDALGRHPARSRASGRDERHPPRARPRVPRRSGGMTSMASSTGSGPRASFAARSSPGTSSIAMKHVSST